MCDEDTVRDNEEFLARTSQVTRRQFNTLAAGTALSLVFPVNAKAQTVTENSVNVTTPDGIADCYFVHPVEGKHAGVIIWPDIMGLRPAFQLMGKRLAESGYSVLVVNHYYRNARAPVVAEGDTFQDSDVRSKIIPFARSLNASTHMADARAFVSFLDQQDAVDTGRKIGTMGYCMGGPITMRTAAAVPDRIGAGASFHGGGLVTDREDSPHLLVPATKAHFLFAIAENDDGRDPEAKNVLRQTYAKAGLPAEIEVYTGALHGWCPPDSPAYNEAQAECAWERLLALFESTLA